MAPSAPSAPLGVLAQPDLHECQAHDADQPAPDQYQSQDLPGHLRVGGEHPKLFATGRQDPEAALIKRQHVPYPVTFCQDNSRCVGEADSKIGVTVNHLASLPHVITRHRRQDISAAPDLREQTRSGAVPDSRGE